MSEVEHHNEGLTPFMLREQYEQEQRKNIEGVKQDSSLWNAFADHADYVSAEFNYRDFPAGERKTELGLDLALVRNDIRNRQNLVPGYKEDFRKITRATDNFIGKNRAFKPEDAGRPDDTASRRAAIETLVQIKNETLKTFTQAPAPTGPPQT